MTGVSVAQTFPAEDMEEIFGLPYDCDADVGVSGLTLPQHSCARGWNAQKWNSQFLLNDVEFWWCSSISTPQKSESWRNWTSEIPAAWNSWLCFPRRSGLARRLGAFLSIESAERLPYSAPTWHQPIDSIALAKAFVWAERNLVVGTNQHHEAGISVGGCSYRQLWPCRSVKRRKQAVLLTQVLHRGSERRRTVTNWELSISNDVWSLALFGGKKTRLCRNLLREYCFTDEHVIMGHQV